MQLLCPHPVKNVADGRPVRVCPVILYSDDTNGNRSQKWNWFNVRCMQYAALPRHENSKLQNIYYICCSNAVKSECMLFFTLYSLVYMSVLFVTNNQYYVIVYICIAMCCALVLYICLFYINGHVSAREERVAQPGRGCSDA